MIRVSEFELFQEIGRGPHGIAHRAFNTRSRRPAVVKEFFGQLSNEPDRRERFDSLIVRLLSTYHPDASAIQRILLHEERLYLARDMVTSSSLGTQLSPGEVDLEHVLECVRSLVPILGHYHDARLIHGNISPENLFQKPDGQLQVSDFAGSLLSRDLTNGCYASSPPSLFIAPEVTAEGDYGPPADVFSLACLMEYWLIGSIHGRNLATRSRATGTSSRFHYIEVDDFQSPTDHSELKDMPESIAIVVHQAQSSNPMERPQTVNEFFQMLVGKSSEETVNGVERETPRTNIVYCIHCRQPGLASRILCGACRKPLRIPDDKPIPSPPVPGSTTISQRKSYYHELGDWLMRRGRVAEAVGVYERAVPHQSSSELFSRLGEAQHSLGRLDRAQKAFERALKLSSDDLHARLSLARILVTQGDYEGGVGHYSHLAHTLNGEVALTARLGIAMARAAQGRFDEAIALMQETVGEHPNNAGVHYCLGRLYVHVGDLRSAEREFRLALTFEPHHKGAEQGMAQAAEQKNVPHQGPVTRTWGRVRDPWSSLVLHL